MKNFKLTLVLILAFCANVIFAAPPPPPSSGPGCWPPPCIPVDNGLIFLICAGLLLGLKSLYNFRKKTSQSF